LDFEELHLLGDLHKQSTTTSLTAHFFFSPSPFPLRKYRIDRQSNEEITSSSSSARLERRSLKESLPWGLLTSLLKFFSLTDERTASDPTLSGAFLPRFFHLPATKLRSLTPLGSRGRSCNLSSRYDLLSSTRGVAAAEPQLSFSSLPGLAVLFFDEFTELKQKTFFARRDVPFHSRFFFPLSAS